MTRLALVATVLTVATPSLAFACLFVDDGPTCGGDGFEVEMPTALCGAWEVNDGGIEYGPIPCDELPGAATTGPTVSVPVATALVDGAALTGGLTMTAHTTAAPIVYTEPGGAVVVMRDWDGVPGELYAWRKAVIDGKVERRTVTVATYDADGGLLGRTVRNGCYPSHWNLQAGAGEALVEQVRIVCPAATAR